jgi:hypothetical protein
MRAPEAMSFEISLMDVASGRWLVSESAVANYVHVHVFDTDEQIQEMSMPSDP